MPTPVCLTCWHHLSPGQPPARQLTAGNPPAVPCGICRKPTTAGVHIHEKDDDE